MNVNSLWIILIILLFCGVFGYFWFFGSNTKNKPKSVTINNKEWVLEVADSPASRTRGLSYRDNLPIDSGMLFIFDKSDFYGFWMLGMKFSIDIVFIDENLKLVDIVHNVSPSSYPKSFKPKWPAKYVLELNAGQSKKFSIIEGQTIDLK